MLHYQEYLWQEKSTILIKHHWESKVSLTQFYVTGFAVGLLNYVKGAVMGPGAQGHVCSDCPLITTQGEMVSQAVGGVLKPLLYNHSDYVTLLRGDCEMNPVPQRNLI